VRKNAARMARLTEDLLVLARVESGEQQFSIRAVQVSELLADAKETFQANSSISGVKLSIQAHDDLCVLADADAVHQVFANLLDNAVKYGGSGRSVEIGAREHEEGVEFYVRDFGPGIASEHLPRLFERFYRVDKARSREAGGTGLGLAIAKHVIRAHGGTIHASSELGHGATFSFVLPLAAQSVAQ
jgi:two-component system phosphate regulon sensor histidine kinase PhoR